VRGKRDGGMKRLWVQVLAFGLVGVAILLSLGNWQLARLAWKEGLISELEARLSAEPAPLPAAPREDPDEYLHVTVEGDVEAEELHVLTSLRGAGPGFRVISAMALSDGRRILLDRGFAREAAKEAPRPAGAAQVTGVLLWPDETDGFTPEPDAARAIWFARDVDTMAAALGTEPLMVVADAPVGEGLLANPVTVNLPNDHLQYAVTWFSLAAIWAGMSIFLLARVLRRGSIY
ncbi:MAG: SURF1 family protein, partial [Pseudomonadota bacterium]